MEAVVELPVWQEVLIRNPGNRKLFLAQDPKEFVATMERWMAAYCPCGDELVPGLPDAGARALDVPALVFRSGTTDCNHTRATSERLAALLPNARLTESPWARAGPGVAGLGGRGARLARLRVRAGQAAGVW